MTTIICIFTLLFTPEGKTGDIGMRLWQKELRLSWCVRHDELLWGASRNSYFRKQLFEMTSRDHAHILSQCIQSDSRECWRVCSLHSLGSCLNLNLCYSQANFNGLKITSFLQFPSYIREIIVKIHLLQFYRLINFWGLFNNFKASSKFYII